MSDEIDNLLRKLNEIIEYYECHNKIADAMDLKNVINEYNEELERLK